MADEETFEIKTGTILQTKLVKCPVCQIGDLIGVKGIKEDIVIYGRSGTRLAKHREHRCNNKNSFAPCRAGILFGYVTYAGKNI